MGAGKEAQDGGDIDIIMAELRCPTTDTNIAL